jgi:hypothetical protein
VLTVIPSAVSSASRPPKREALTLIAADLDSGAEGSGKDYATMDHPEIRRFGGVNYFV